MKKLVKIISGGMVIIFLLNACHKSNSYNNNGGTTNGHAFVAVTNASPGAAMYDVFDDSTKLTAAGQLGYGSTSGVSGNPYYVVPSSEHAIRLTSDGGSSFVIDTTINFADAGHYSVFGYDTLSSGKLKTLILTDNLSAPASGKAAVRFLDLSSHAPTLDVWLISGIDSTSMTNIGYVGSGVISSDSLASFTTVNAGTYRILINNAVDADANLFHADSVSLESGKIYTIYTKGFAVNGMAADSLSLGTIQNF